MAFPLPSWLQVSPAFYTQALEAGARAGIAVTEQQQRAQHMAEARAERTAQQAERQRQFEESRLIDLQRLIQQASHQRALETQQAAELAQLGDYRQQQARHQAAQEANQAAQESRLLQYNLGQLALGQRNADIAEKHLEPTSLDTNAVEVVDPASGKRFGLMTRRGLNSQQLTPDRVEKGLTAPQLGALYNAQERSLMNELESLDMLKAGGDPKHPKRPQYDELQSKLLDVRRHRDALVPPSVVTNAPVSSITGRIKPLPKVKADLVTDDFYDIKGTAYRWDGANFKRVPTR